MTHHTADYVILGGGPTGSTAATLLARAGFEVIVLERAFPPAAAVGESLLPFGSRVIEKLGVPMDGFIRKDGAVFTRGDGVARFAFRDAARTPWDHAWQVPRDLFDARVREAAVAAGVRYVETRALRWEEPRSWVTEAGTFTARRRAIDAAGRGQLIARQLGIRQLHPRLRNAAVAAPHRGVRRFEPEEPGDITLCAFQGGWFWFIPFADGRTSVGAVTTPVSGINGDRWQAALERCPEARARLEGAERVGPMQGVQDFTAYAGRFHGDGWALLGDAAMFLDPIFSTGVLFGLEAADRFVTAELGDGDLDAWEAHLRATAEVFENAILAWYDGDFMDCALTPAEHQRDRYIKGIVSLLAGDAFDPGNRLATNMAWALKTIARHARDAGLVERPAWQPAVPSDAG